MNQPPTVPIIKEPLTLREHEEYIRKTFTTDLGESQEERRIKLARCGWRLRRVRKDMARQDKRGTLRLMDALGHRFRAAELLEIAEKESNQEKAAILFMAANVHLRHARRLDAEAAEKENDAV